MPGGDTSPKRAARLRLGLRGTLVPDMSTALLPAVLP